jgi:hypothetical protein
MNIFKIKIKKGNKLAFGSNDGGVQPIKKYSDKKCYQSRKKNPYNSLVKKQKVPYNYINAINEKCYFFVCFQN